jgi:hypothetical protein
VVGGEVSQSAWNRVVENPPPTLRDELFYASELSESDGSS